MGSGQQATRNQVTLKYFAHDVRIMQAKAKLQPVTDALTGLVEDYKTIEKGFADSILEAGGGRCGSGGRYPYIASGGIIFRAPQGRAEIEKEIAYLQQALQAGHLLPDAFPK